MASTTLSEIPAVLTPKQYAATTGTPFRTVQAMCKEGRIPAKKLPGSSLWRISGAALRAWLQALDHPATTSTSTDEGAGDGRD